MSEKQLTAVLIAACSALAHYQEYADTHHSLDRIAAESALDSPALRRWLKENAVLIPLRRDGKTMLEATKK
jgi:hypothetical protein